MALTTGKAIEILFENVLDTYEQQDQLINRCEFFEPDPAALQNAGNVIWRPAQQHAPIIAGVDLTGLETGIIEEVYPAILGTAQNDLVKQSAPDMRDPEFWRRRGIQSGKRQATELNKQIASAIAIQGSLFYRSNDTSGYSFISQAQAIMNERQLVDNMRTYVLNDRDSRLFGEDLAGRQTLQGRPEDVWAKGQIAQNVAGFDVFTGSYLPNIAGGASPDTDVTANLSEAPEGGSVNTSTGVVTNVDYRSSTITVTASANYAIGDKVTIGASQSLSLADKQATGQLMTFTVVAKPAATSITVYPKPIALDDPALSTLEAAYANIDTQILIGDIVTRLNIDATNKTNIFFDRSAVEVMGGTIPANLFQEFAGKKVITETMPNGLNMYMLYDGDIITLDFRFRLFTWYGITIANPSNCGVAVTY